MTWFVCMTCGREFVTKSAAETCAEQDEFEGVAVETFKRLNDTVPTIQDAFGFVMDHLDEFTAPSIEIRPWTGEDGVHHFDVTMSGVR